MADLLEHQTPAPDVTKRMEEHIRIRWERYWQDLALFESKRHEDPAQHLFLLRMKFRKRLRMLKEAGIHEDVIRRNGLDDPRRSDIDFNIELAGAKKRREERKRHANRIGNSTEQSPERERTEANPD